MSRQCVACRETKYTDYKMIDLGRCCAPMCSNCQIVFIRMDDEMEPENGDTVEFVAADEFGPTTGTGTIMRLFKNGNAVIHCDGRQHRTHYYTVLSKAG